MSDCDQLLKQAPMTSRELLVVAGLIIYTIGLHILAGLGVAYIFAWIVGWGQ